MNPLTRGMRNAFRNTIRTSSIILILGLSIGLALAMLVARAAVNDKINALKSSVGTTITVSPAGARGFEGGGEPLTSAQLAKVSRIGHVASLSQTLGDRLTSDNTNLVSAIQAGSLGRRRAANDGVGFQAAPDAGRAFGGGGGQAGQEGGMGQFNRTFTPPVTVTGTNVLTDNSYGGTSVSYIAGQAIDPAKDADVAVVGKALADKNGLKAGSTFQAYGTAITVKGIYDAGNAFANAGLIMPLATVQRLSGQAGDVTGAIVTVDSVDNLQTATTAIKSTLGSAADVVSSQDAANQAIQPLQSVRTISTFSLVGAVVAGAAIILLTMVMVVRERRREIGVYKAIGASNLRIMLQFMSEAVTLTLLAMVAGVLIAAAIASPVTKVLVANSASSTQTAMAQGVPGGRGLGGGRRFALAAASGFGRDTAANVRAVKADVGTGIIGYGFGAALVIALVGSALPAFLISKIRPAEVMRAE